MVTDKQILLKIPDCDQHDSSIWELFLSVTEHEIFFLKLKNFTEHHFQVKTTYILIEAAKSIFCLQSGWQEVGASCPSAGRKGGQTRHSAQTTSANSYQPGDGTVCSQFTREMGLLRPKSLNKMHL